MRWLTACVNFRQLFESLCSMPVGIWMRIRLVCAPVRYSSDRSTHTLWSISIGKQKANYLVCSAHDFCKLWTCQLARLSLWWTTEGGVESCLWGQCHVPGQRNPFVDNLITCSLSLFLKNFLSKSREKLLISTICFGLLSLLDFHYPFL